MMGRLLQTCIPGSVSWTNLFFVYVVVVCTNVSSSSLPEVLRIGVLYDDIQTFDDEQLLLRILDRANWNATEARGAPSGTQFPRAAKLDLAFRKISPKDAFHSAKQVCKLLEQGLLALIGPRHPTTASLAKTACARHRVPHIYLHRELLGRGPPPDSASFTVTPSPEELGLAIRDLVVAQQWRHFTLVYEKPEALIRLQGILELQSPETGLPVSVTLRIIPPDHDLKPVLRDIAKAGESNLLLDVAARRLEELLKYAQKIGIVTEYHNYIVSTLDLHTVDLSDFRHSRTNLTGFELLERELWEQDPGVTREAYASMGIYPVFLRTRPTRKPLNVDSALAQDALEMLLQATKFLARTKSLGWPASVRCHSNPLGKTWVQARALIEAVKNLRFSGLSGPVFLDPFGRRYNLTLHVLQLKKAGLASIGSWSPESGLKITRTASMVQEEIMETLQNKTFKITTLINAPYVMLKESASRLSGNDRFEGFCVDLVREMSRLLGFRYQLRLVRDGSYGTRNRDGRWNGMVREIIDREADLALADLTITYSRDEAVDFTTPFMTLGIGILFRKPQENQALLFFLSPLSVDVWLCMALAYLGVSLLLCLVARFSPAEYYYSENTQLCDHHSGCPLRNRFTLLNSLWFTISAIMQQGCENSPRSVPARVIAASWWFFSFVVISSYTANLASFLTRERLRSPIDSAEDLARQSHIRYGCVRSGSTEAFFKESKSETYERMWQAMSGSLADSNADGVSRVQAGGYAFLMESTTIEYVVERNCQLTQVGGLLDSKGYGIAMPAGSPYRSHLSAAILRLQEDGTMQMLKNRWWKVGPPKHCPEQSRSETLRPGSASELGLAKVGGVFVVLLGGLGIACVIAFVEFFCKARSFSKSKHRKLPFELEEQKDSRV
ncbi:glutamate receptor ionotropic, kainate 2 isoform X1 [Ixodes scapularis]|uniref:glutamate receptor ionotropic, kainate 2 isoform X1 n=1 Tax=Ixodes scapularis TaxID=6945 RepID=UPI001A9EE518|nr:glutamate receptor ionotropic, kainate 2 isoform X1 [Ixodes scapularis]